MDFYTTKMKKIYKRIITLHGIEQSVLVDLYPHELFNMKNVYSLALMKPHTNGLLEKVLSEIEKID